MYPFDGANRGSTAANTAYYTYDAFDRVVEACICDADGTVVYRETCAYDDTYTNALSCFTKTVHGDAKSPDLVSVTYTDKYGEVVKTDEGGVVTEYAYDYVGNPIRAFVGATTLATYTYDFRGNATSETDPYDNTRTFTYDGFGRKVAETDFKGNTTKLFRLPGIIVVEGRESNPPEARKSKLQAFEISRDNSSVRARSCPTTARKNVEEQYDELQNEL